MTAAIAYVAMTYRLRIRPALLRARMDWHRLVTCPMQGHQDEPLSPHYILDVDRTAKWLGRCRCGRLSKMRYARVKDWVLAHPFHPIAGELRVQLVRYSRTLRPLPIREYLERVWRREGLR